MHQNEICSALKEFDVSLLFDALESLGHKPRLLNLDIRLHAGRGRLVGPALTIGGRPDPRPRSEREPEPWQDFRLFDAISEGHVLLIATGGERVAGVWGEILSTAAREKGAVGVVVDGLVRDIASLRDMELWEVFATGSSPVEGNGRWQPVDFNKPVAIPGALDDRVRVEPGEWVVADEDGILVVAEELIDELIEAVTKLRDREQATRIDLLAGESFATVYGRYEAF